jgi:hypothetical protein
MLTKYDRNIIKYSIFTIYPIITIRIDDIKQRSKVKTPHNATTVTFFSGNK